MISGSTFIGSTPGTYTVTGQTASGLTGTVKIGVFGAATGLVIHLPPTVVANKVSHYTATVDVVDANGNTVADNTDDIKLSNANIAIAGVDNGSGTPQGSQDYNAVNGVATLTIDAGSVGGASELIYAADGAPGSTVPFNQATLTTTAQVATSLSVSAQTYIEANQPKTGTASVSVLDQTGNPMLSGADSVNMSLTGPAAFTADGTTGPETGAFVGNGGNGTPADFPFTSIQSETGAVTFTATATGLTAGTGTTTAVIAGVPAAIQITPVAGNSFSEDNWATGLTYDIQIVDSHGYPVGVTEPLTVSVLNSNGIDATQSPPGNDWVAPSSTSTASDGSDSLTITDSAFDPNAGTYTLQVSDGGTLGLTASPTVTITETAGAAKYLTESSPTYVSASSPTATYSAQLTDAYGNKVAEAGVPITFTPDAGNPHPFTDNSAVTVDTNASGVATASFTAPPYTGDKYFVTASSGTLTHADQAFTVEPTIATGVTVTVENGTTNTPQTVFTAGDQVKFKISASDPYGTPVSTLDNITLSYGGTGGLKIGVTGVPLGAGGTITIPDFVTTAGTITVTVNDTSVASAPSASATLAVTAKTWDGWEVVDANGNVVGSQSVYGTYSAGKYDTATLSVSANTPVELWLKPIDAYGNPLVLTPGDVIADGGAAALTAPPGTGTGAAGEFRLSANGSDVPTDPLTAGDSQLPVWYVNTLNQTGLNFDAAAY